MQYYRPRRRMSGILDAVDPTDPGTQQAATEVVSTITSFITSLIKSINVGDQVPGYPIKSPNTLQGILESVHGNFPEPNNVAEAQEELTRAIQWSKDAYAKGGPVNTTYGMIYDEVAARLKAYIQNGGVAPPTVTDPKTGLPKQITQQSSILGDPKVLLFAGGAVLLFALMNRKKRR